MGPATPRRLIPVGRLDSSTEKRKMGIRLTQVAPISCGLGIFLGSVTG